jgi:hypothetical protein
MPMVFCSPSRYTQGKDATAILGAEMAGLGLSGPALVVGGRHLRRPPLARRGPAAPVARRRPASDGRIAGPVRPAADAGVPTLRAAVRAGVQGDTGLGLPPYLSVRWLASRKREWQSTAGYRLSQRGRKHLEEALGWLKGVARLGRSRVVERGKLRQLFELGAAADHRVRMRKLAPA